MGLDLVFGSGLRFRVEVWAYYVMPCLILLEPYEGHMTLSASHVKNPLLL